MGLPGKRLSRSSKRRRASHFALKKTMLTQCQKCRKMILPHLVCAHCGTYKNRQVVPLKLPKMGKSSTLPQKNTQVDETKDRK